VKVIDSKMLADVATFPEWVDAMLTAAVSATRIKLLSPITSHSPGIIGTGVKSVFQSLFAYLRVILKRLKRYFNYINKLK
jgi:hypothetical protein